MTKSLSDADRQLILSRGWTLTDEEMLLIVNNLNQMRISTQGQWTPGSCKLTTVNRFDSFGKAGVRDGDVIIAINGSPVTDEPAFALTLSGLGIGAKPVLQIRRGDEVIDLTVELLRKTVSFEIDELQVAFERKISPVSLLTP